MQAESFFLVIFPLAILFFLIAFLFLQRDGEKSIIYALHISVFISSFLFALFRAKKSGLHCSLRPFVLIFTLRVKNVRLICVFQFFSYFTKQIIVSIFNTAVSQSCAIMCKAKAQKRKRKKISETERTVKGEEKAITG